MTRAYVTTGEALAVVAGQSGRWSARLTLEGLPTQCVAAHPSRPERVACGTFGKGLWLSDDAGDTWRHAGADIPLDQVMAVAFSRLESNVLWAGTEPSALFRSEDGGQSWRECSALRELPSAPTWSFPPRPWTSHVRWIAPDPCVAERIFVGIELGGVMRSLDDGRTWEDRKPVSQPDAHTLATHPMAPDRVYEAAGGGYAESFDGGATWQRHDEGLTRGYIYGLAVDPGDPETVVVSSARGPRQAHDRSNAEAAVYRRVGSGPWQESMEGLPGPTGSRAFILAANEAEPGVFYATTRDGRLYRSPDAGQHWEPLPIDWPTAYKAPNAEALAVVPD